MADQEGVRGTGTTPDEAILPTWLNQRALTFWDFNYIWIGLAVVIVPFEYGANGVVADYTIPTVLAIVWFAIAALAILMTATADIGTEHGLSFAVYLRALFGTVGTHLPAVSRGCDYSWELRQETPAVPADPVLSALLAKAVEDSGSPCTDCRAARATTRRRWRRSPRWICSSCGAKRG